jgi:hypothetical protein
MASSEPAATRNLRPLSFSQILDTTFALYRENFVLFAGTYAVLGIPQAIINIVVALATPAPPTAPTGTVGANAFLSYYATVAGSSGVAGGIGFIFTTIGTGALAKAVSSRYLGKPATIEGTYRSIGPRRFLALLGATLLYIVLLGLLAAVGIGISIGAGFALPLPLNVIVIFVFAIVTLVAVIYLAVSFVFVPQAVIIEQRSVTQALARSVRLVRGSWWRVLGVIAILTIIVSIISGIGGSIVGALLQVVSFPEARAIVAGFSAIVMIFVGPVQLVGNTLLYYDLRIRKEAFDLEQLAASLHPRESV